MNTNRNINVNDVNRITIDLIQSEFEEIYDWSDDAALCRDTLYVVYGYCKYATELKNYIQNDK